MKNVNTCIILDINRRQGPINRTLDSWTEHASGLGGGGLVTVKAHVKLPPSVKVHFREEEEGQTTVRKRPLLTLAGP